MYILIMCFIKNVFAGMNRRKTNTNKAPQVSQQDQPGLKVALSYERLFLLVL